MFGDIDWPLNASRGFVSISYKMQLSQKLMTKPIKPRVQTWLYRYRSAELRKFSNRYLRTCVYLPPIGPHGPVNCFRRSHRLTHSDQIWHGNASITTPPPYPDGVGAMGRVSGTPIPRTSFPAALRVRRWTRNKLVAGSIPGHRTAE